MMLDNDVLNAYREQAEQVGKGYQTFINDTLRVQAGLPTALGMQDMLKDAVEATSVGKIAEKVLATSGFDAAVKDFAGGLHANAATAGIRPADLAALAGYSIQAADIENAMGLKSQVAAIERTLDDVKKALEPLEALKAARDMWSQK